MSDDVRCSCLELQSSEHSPVSEGWIRWLDRRNEVRTAWTVLSIEGALNDIRSLPRSLKELRQQSRLDSPTQFVRTKDELWEAVSDGQLRALTAERLPSQALEKFVSGVEFVDYKIDGQRYRHVGGSYFGDLQIKHSFSFLELFQLYAVFGMGPELTVRAYDKFGWDVDQSKCQPRIYFSCPWSADC